MLREKCVLVRFCCCSCNIASDYRGSLLQGSDVRPCSVLQLCVVLLGCKPITTPPALVHKKLFDPAAVVCLFEHIVDNGVDLWPQRKKKENIKTTTTTTTTTTKKKTTTGGAER